MTPKYGQDPDPHRSALVLLPIVRIRTEVKSWILDPHYQNQCGSTHTGFKRSMTGVEETQHMLGTDRKEEQIYTVPQ